MSGGGGGGGSSTQTSTTTTDVPVWMRGYMQDVLGRADTIANQPYQQYGGQQIAGFTPDQMAAFSQIQNLPGQYAGTQQAALNSATAGANSANNIYGAGAGAINDSLGYNPLAAISPYLNSASGYNSAAAGQPWLNQASGFQSAASQAGAPGGIMDYMSPYTNSVVQGIQDQANQNWNQNIMPGINDKFVGSGQYGSGRNAQVLGQAAGNFQTGLSANVANALQSGYNTAANSAAQQAQLLSGLGAQSLQGASTAGGLQNQQIGNLLNQANAAGTAANQQAQNMQSAGTSLGNLAATQAGQQSAAGVNLGNLAQQQQQMGLNSAQALQAVGQQQQQLNQSNLDQAKADYMAQASHPQDMTSWMAGIIRGLPAQNASQTTTQNPAYATSPLAALMGAGSTALSLSGNITGSAKKKGGVVKKYAAGGIVTADDEDKNPLATVAPDSRARAIELLYGDAPQDDESAAVMRAMSKQVGKKPMELAMNDTPNPLEMKAGTKLTPAEMMADPASAKKDIGTTPSKYDAEFEAENQAKTQRNQLLAIARGMLTPSRTGTVGEGLGQGIGYLQDYELKKEGLDISRDRTALGGGDPSTVRAFKAYEQMTPEQRVLYQEANRANQYVDTGAEIIRPNTGQVIKKELKPGERPEVRGEQKTAEKTAESEVERKTGLSKAQGALVSLESQAKIVTDNIDKALKVIEKPYSAATGYARIAGAGGALPNSDARQLDNYLNTIKANVGFDKLQQMRDNSPTGGALGQVSEKENLLLQAVNGAMDPLARDQLKDNLQTIKKLYPEVMAERRRAFKQDYGKYIEQVPVEETIVTTPKDDNDPLGLRKK